MFRAGDRIGNYDIVAPLKSGGMGTTFIGRRVGVAGFQRSVAIKVIHPHLASDDSFVQAFVNEALLSARISHPNVVRVEELGEKDGTHYMVMEYVDGTSLAQLMRALTKRERGLSPAAAVAIAIRVAEGLHAAHETRGDDGAPLNLVHRDVSPQNILVTFAGHVKLIDFGIAKARTIGDQSSIGSLKGKIAYMSPEQAHGRQVDRRTDVYALGIVLWELLARHRLFKKKDDDLAILDRVRNPKVAPPSAHAKGVTRALDRAVLHALAPDPARRPATAQELRRVLLDALPEALSVDASHLAPLFFKVMPEQIEAQRRAERSASESPIAPPKGDDRILETLTVPAPQLEAALAEVSGSEKLLLTGVEEVSRPPERRSTRLVAALSLGLVVAGACLAAALLIFGRSAPEPIRLPPPPIDRAPPTPAPTKALRPAPVVEPDGAGEEEASPTPPTPPPAAKKKKKKGRMNKKRSEKGSPRRTLERSPIESDAALPFEETPDF